ncbi:MAG: hypothetical protein U0936_11595 [Planctomycetaceae bacterium]
MTIHKHQICLESEQHFDGRLPSHHLGFLLADLPVAVRGAVSMALCNRSKTLGKQPEWLKRASDLRFTGHAGNGLTQLQFELPSLDTAASEVYRQAFLFESGRPEGHLTGLDLLMNVVSDIDNGKADSNDTFDPQLLNQVSRFKRFFKGGPFSGFRISRSGGDARHTVHVTQSTSETR